MTVLVLREFTVVWLLVSVSDKNDVSRKSPKRDAQKNFNTVNCTVVENYKGICLTFYVTMIMIFCKADNDLHIVYTVFALF